MKYLKEFEDLGYPRVGDYVILDAESIAAGQYYFMENTDLFKDYLFNNIGQIHNIITRTNKANIYQIIFDVDLADDEVVIKVVNNLRYYADIGKYGVSVLISEILEYSSSREELEIKLKSMKYNL